MCPHLATEAYNGAVLEVRKKIPAHSYEVLKAAGGSAQAAGG